jgi:hypothetical protein
MFLEQLRYRKSSLWFYQSISTSPFGTFVRHGFIVLLVYGPNNRLENEHDYIELSIFLTPCGILMVNNNIEIQYFVARHFLMMNYQCLKCTVRDVIQDEQIICHLVTSRTSCLYNCDVYRVIPVGWQTQYFISENEHGLVQTKSNQNKS